MEEIYQRVFKESMVDKLSAESKTNNGLKSYYVSELEYPNDSTISSNYKVGSSLPLLDPTVEADAKNAVLIYEYYKGLNRTQATDRRLWTYLSHVAFREYTIKRWAIKPFDELQHDAKAMQSAKKTVSNRWLLGGGVYGLVRGSLSRLWWGANLTYSPYLLDSNTFSTLENEDEYIYTKLLMSKSAIFIAITDRSLGGCPKMRFAILECLRRIPELEKREYLWPFMRELNLVYGYRRLESLEFAEILDVVSETANFAVEANIESNLVNS